VIRLRNIRDTYTDYVCTKIQLSISKTRGVLAIGRYHTDELSGFSGIFFAISCLRYRGRGRGLAKIFFALTREKNFRCPCVLRCHVTRFVRRPLFAEQGSAYVFGSQISKKSTSPHQIITVLKKGLVRMLASLLVESSECHFQHR
jgi:hypothetical protein